MKLSEILKNLVNENEENLNNLVNYLQVKDAQIIYAWMRGDANPTLKNLISLADFFNCSLEYLIGRNEDFGSKIYKKPNKFYSQLHRVMEEKGVSKYKMCNLDKICSSRSLTRWKNFDIDPQVDTLVKLADYFHVTVDYLVGRE